MRKNQAPLEISGEEFRKAGYMLVDQISEFLNTIDKKKVTTGESPEQVQKITGKDTLPEKGASPEEILARASDLLFGHSLLNGHPRFFGYITGSPAPIGALADLLASSVNPNVGANILSPVATELEKQTVRWLAELTGIPSSYGGLLVSGGNMANFTGFLAARSTKAPINLKTDGISGLSQKMTIYCSQATHTWIEKAAIHFGMGSSSLRWIKTVEDSNKIDTDALEQAVQNDIRNGYVPMMVIGNAGDVSTGVVDDLEKMSKIGRKYDVWFHVDGAYGLPASIVPEYKNLFRGIEEADSIAIDPHKWLYSPLEAGCTLVKNPDHLKHAFSSHPVYYNFDDKDSGITNFYEYGLQNSRGFRALKVWCALQQAGRSGYEKMISHDIAMSKLLYLRTIEHPELEDVTQNLSITTLRYVPEGFNQGAGNSEAILNELNEKLLNELQKGGEAFLSNAVVKGKYCLRACIVNFRTTEQDIEETIDAIVRTGRKVGEAYSFDWLSERVTTD
ncbi:MAG TPA: aspartate aminotransferase family protein [Bacteroidales bacterium]|nr:aspartate aminotransferase family protein [Bacteroidales bacterium]